MGCGFKVGAERLVKDSRGNTTCQEATGSDSLRQENPCSEPQQGPEPFPSGSDSRRHLQGIEASQSVGFRAFFRNCLVGFREPVAKELSGRKKVCRRRFTSAAIPKPQALNPKL